MAFFLRQAEGFLDAVDKKAKEASSKEARGQYSKQQRVVGNADCPTAACLCVHPSSVLLLQIAGIPKEAGAGLQEVPALLQSPSSRALRHQQQREYVRGLWKGPRRLRLAARSRTDCLSALRLA